MPAEEPNAYLGGHWYLMTPKPVYFSHAEPRPAGQPFEEEDPVYGHVYHLGSTDDVLKMVNRENGIFWTAHPRTKSSEGYPENIQGQGLLPQRPLHRRLVGVFARGSVREETL